MFCNQCGNQLNQGAKFCRVCGREVPTPNVSASEAPTSEFPSQFAGTPDNSAAAYVPAPEVPTEGKAVGSLISGIVGLTVIPVIASIVAIVLGHMSLSTIRQSAGRLKGHGMAIAGLVMGYLGVAIIPIVVLIVAGIAIPTLLRSRILANEAVAIASIRTINGAELRYSHQFPEKGFTCSLADLGPRDGVGAADDAANLIEASLASGTKAGYNFTLRNCEKDSSDGQVVRYKLVAMPVTADISGTRTFCSDESNEIRYVRRASADACLTDGEPVE